MQNRPSIWKPVLRYEGFYEVSIDGKVRSVDRFCTRGQFRPGRVLKHRISTKGYPMVCLHRANKQKVTHVHQLVAQAFIPRVEGKEWVNHIDGVKTNNHATNLEWVTPAENFHHAVSIGLCVMGEDVPHARLTRNKVREIRRRLNDGEKMTVLAKEYGVAYETVKLVKYRKTWKGIEPLT